MAHLFNSCRFSAFLFLCTAPFFVLQSKSASHELAMESWEKAYREWFAGHQEGQKKLSPIPPIDSSAGQWYDQLQVPFRFLKHTNGQKVRGFSSIEEELKFFHQGCKSHILAITLRLAVVSYLQSYEVPYNVENERKHSEEYKDLLKENKKTWLLLRRSGLK